MIDDERLDNLLTEISASDRAAATESGLVRRVLDDFDAIAKRKDLSVGAGLAAMMFRLADAAWPGAPLWKPACALGLALAFGLGVGALLPFYDSPDETTVAYEAPQGIDLDGDLQ